MHRCQRYGIHLSDFSLWVTRQELSEDWSIYWWHNLWPCFQWEETCAYVQYGWQKSEDGATVYPTTLPAGMSTAPATILQLIKCGCSTSRPCSTGRCGCVAVQMSCSMFCCCNAGSDCCNEQTRVVANNQDEDDDLWACYGHFNIFT